jgi:hypothetical protein
MKTRPAERYICEKVEAYNVAISALQLHESADPHPDHLDFTLRKRLAAKLDREIQRWVNSLPEPNATSEPMPAPANQTIKYHERHTCVETASPR